MGINYLIVSQMKIFFIMTVIKISLGCALLASKNKKFNDVILGSGKFYRLSNLSIIEENYKN